MRKSTPKKPSNKGDDPPDSGPVRKVLLRRTIHRKRSNSIGAYGCGREATVAATTCLSCACRRAFCENDLPFLDDVPHKVTSETEPKRRNSDRGGFHPAFLDLPLRCTKILGVNRWNFDIFSIKRFCSSNLICPLGLRLFELHRLFDRLRLNRMVVVRALTAIESVYWQHNPYHTALHAADVAQALHCFISSPKLLCLLSPAEILGSILAAFCHDADHPGTNQAHLERTKHFLVGLYDGNSVLEQHHARMGLTILQQSGLAECLSRKDWNTLRECFVKMIHATDMAQQNHYKTKFAKLVDTKGTQPVSILTTGDKILLLQMSLKCADISNPCRPWELCQRWAYRVCEEFFSQGDQERHQWTLSPLKGFDRHNASIPAIQVAFIDNCIRPLFQLWDKFFRNELSKMLLQFLNENYIRWQKLSSITSRSKSATESSLSPLPRDANSDKLKMINCTLNPQMFVTPVPKKGSHSAVAFNLSSGTKLDQPEVGKESGGERLETFIITTCGLRRHSLPETQGAIRKTFNFARSKRASPTQLGIVQNSVVVVREEPSTFCLPDVFCVYVTSSCSRTLRTASKNILQTLCEEIISQQPDTHQPTSAFSPEPFPLPQAWNKTGKNLNVFVATRNANCCTKVGVNMSLHQLINIQRRGSVPITERWHAN